MAQSYDVIGSSASLPSYATVTPSGQSTFVWTASSTDVRALQVVGGGSRIAACWYSSGSFTVDVDLTDGQTHDLELYFLDWDTNNRAESVQISNAATGAVLNTQSISSFHNGVYLDYAVSGNIVITITRTAGTNAVLSGLFLDPSATRQGASAAFVKSDATTQGTWIGTYGAQGYDVIGSSASLPSYATVAPSGQSTFVWTSSSTDARALQVAGGGSRIAACWYSSGSFTVDVDLTDGQTHDLELYFLDWDTSNRAESVQISDAATGAVLSTQSISSFHNGLYLDYTVSGNILITITKTGGANAVLSGLFLDPKSSSTTALVGPTSDRASGRTTVQARPAGELASISGFLEMAGDGRLAPGSGASSPEGPGPSPRAAAVADSPGMPADRVSTLVTTKGRRPDGNFLRAVARRLARQPSGMVPRPPRLGSQGQPIRPFGR